MTFIASKELKVQIVNSLGQQVRTISYEKFDAKKILRVRYKKLTQWNLSTLGF